MIGPGLRIEPPAPTRLERLVGVARSTFQSELCERTARRGKRYGLKVG